MSALEQALAMARRGLAVFPLRPGTKEPYGETRGHKDASLDEKVIRSWFEAVFPGCNYGVVPGEDHVVIDVDIKNGKRGDVELTRLEAENEDLPRTFEVRTPTGGTHLYFRTPETISSSRGKVASAIDVRGHNGYVVGPGSTVDGKVYRPSSAVAFAEAPSWLRSVCSAKSTAADNADTHAFPAADLPINQKKAVQYIDSRPDCPEGERNDTAFLVACTMRDLGLSQDRALQLTSAWNNERCRPPLPVGEISRTVDSAYRNAQGEFGSRATLGTITIDDIRDEVRDLVQEDRENPQRKRLTKLYYNEVKEMAEPKWLIDKVVPAECIAAMYGPWGHYKSFIALDMALRVACGMDWAGHDIAEARPVVYVAGEGVYGVKLRTAAWCQHNRREPEFSKFILIPSMPLVGSRDNLEELLELVRSDKPGMIVIDTIARAMAGMNENAAEDCSVLLDRCAQLQHELKTAVLLVGHTGKDRSRGIRGNSALEAGLDTILSVERVREGQALVSVRKQKEGDEVPAIGLHAQRVKFLDDTMGGFSSSSLVMQPGAVEPNTTAKQEVAEYRKEVILEVLEQNPTDFLTTAALTDVVADRTGEDPKTVDTFLRAQAREGRDLAAMCYVGKNEWVKPSHVDVIRAERCGGVTIKDALKWDSDRNKARRKTAQRHKKESGGDGGTTKASL